MAKENKRKGFAAAETVVDCFAEYIAKQGRKFITLFGHRYNRLATADDDVYGAFVTAWYYHAHVQSLGYCPKVDVIGGYGMMSGKINPKKNGKRLSEAEMLKYVLVRLGVREQDIDIVCSQGTNTGQNLAAYADALAERNADKQEILFCLTKRLAGRFYLTQVQQQPQLDADYAWIMPVVECQLYNGKSFAGCLPYLSEAASIYDRYLRYSKPDKQGRQFMAEMDEPLSKKVVAAGEYLCQHYKLKTPELSLKKVWQYAVTYGYFLLHKEACRRSLERNIQNWQQKLIEAYNLRLWHGLDELSGDETLKIV